MSPLLASGRALSPQEFVEKRLSTAAFAGTSSVSGWRIAPSGSTKRKKMVPVGRPSDESQLAPSRRSCSESEKGLRSERTMVNSLSGERWRLPWLSETGVPRA